MAEDSSELESGAEELKAADDSIDELNSDDEDDEDAQSQQTRE